jgi:hypothetical protein
VRPLAPFLVAFVLATSCGNEAPRVIPTDDLTNEDMERLVPFDLLPAGLTPLPQEPDHPSVVLPDTPYYVAGYEFDDGSKRILLSLKATGEPSLALAQIMPVEEMCDRWTGYSGSDTCPIEEVKPVGVGDESMAYASSPHGSDREYLHAEAFIRSGILIGTVVLSTDPSPQDFLPALLEAIDHRIEALADEKLGE